MEWKEEDEKALIAAKTLRDYCKWRNCKKCVFLYRGAMTPLKDSCRLQVDPREFDFRGIKNKGRRRRDE